MDKKKLAISLSTGSGEADGVEYFITPEGIEERIEFNDAMETIQTWIKNFADGDVVQVFEMKKRK